MPELILWAFIWLCNTAMLVFFVVGLRQLRKSAEELTVISKAIIALCERECGREGEREPEKKEKTESEKLSEQLEQGIVNILNYKIEDALKERSHAGN